jgi:predicted RNA binding protein YcfA (HicA-like mRNA interferase family)
MYKSLSSSDIIKILENNGFVFKSKKGSHAKYVKTGQVVIVPHPKPYIPVGTFLSIVRQSGLSKDIFYKGK